MAREPELGRRDTVNVKDVRVLKVVDLLVDEDNFRLEPSADQPTAIRAMVRRQGPKLVRMAESLIDERPSRGEFIWVAPDPRAELAGKYVVCEGNRRVTAIKVLNSPALAEGTPWAQQFRDLSKRFKSNPIRSVRAILYVSVEDARPDVYRRHTNDQNGTGLEDWDPFAQDRANKAQGRRRNLSMVVMEHLTPTTIEAYADSIGLRERTTNADRLLGTFSREVASRLGIRLSGAKPYGVELGSEPVLSERVLAAILSASNVSVDAIKNSHARRSFLEGIVAEQIALAAQAAADNDEAPPADASDTAPPPPDDVQTDEDGATHDDDVQDDAADGRRRGGPARDPLDRATLAPKDRARALPVRGVRLTGLYKECKTVVVADQPNAAAMLMRVFLELSCEEYLERKRIRLPGTGRSNWSDYGISLETKVTKVLNVIDPARNIRELVSAHDGLSVDSSQSHSIKSLHRAMHDRGHVLEPRQIKLVWERWHPLFEHIYTALA